MRTFGIYIMLALLAVSCRKEDETAIDGPDLNDLFGPFSIVEEIKISHQTVNFPVDGNVFYSGELSKNTTWEISITGASTGAQRTITGFDRILSIENTAWNGGATNFPGFGLEDAYIELVFPDEPEAPIIRDTVTIAGTKIDDGYFITGFEEGLGSNWTVFNQTTVAGSIQCGSGEAAKGNCLYSFAGAVPWDWAIGSVMIRPDEGTFGLPASASNLFFNMGFKAIENYGPTNSFILFWFDEDDNGDGVFDENTEDRFTYEYWSTGNQWDLISILYSSLKTDAEGNPVETAGNGLPEPAKLVSINVFFLANPDNGFSEAQVDHLIFTTNSPYTP
ncbi:MAG: hypothetical protein KDC12_00825 [Flavobacteriales bacterium]|nr:hypothetical protein [Flavobacteriales bacterium]